LRTKITQPPAHFHFLSAQRFFILSPLLIEIPLTHTLLAHEQYPAQPFLFNYFSLLSYSLHLQPHPPTKLNENERLQLASSSSRPTPPAATISPTVDRHLPRHRNDTTPTTTRRTLPFFFFFFLPQLTEQKPEDMKKKETCGNRLIHFTSDRQT